MPRLAANLTMLFTDLAFEDRFEAARRAGFQGVEMLFPYDIPASTLRKAANRARMPVALINTPAPNWSGGPRGFAAVPDNAPLFQRDFLRALKLARTLKARHIHIMAGNASGDDAHRAFIANLTWAAAQDPDQSLTIEPINQTDRPGYFLSDFDQAAAILEQVGAANLGLQYDAYHAQMITGDALEVLQRHLSHIRHVQIAGCPGRAEPTGGQIDYPAIFAALDRAGYDGWISAEYHPAGLTEPGLGWLSDMQGTKARSIR